MTEQLICLWLGAMAVGASVGAYVGCYFLSRRHETELDGLIEEKDGCREALRKEREAHRETLRRYGTKLGVSCNHDFDALCPAPHQRPPP